MKLKKFLTLVLASAMTLTMVASCGTTEEPTEPKAETKTETTVESEETEGETLPDIIKKEGEIHMATNAAFQPYEYLEGGKIVGIDAEIAEAIAEKLGKTLVIDDMEFNSIITAVQSGIVDFGMAGMTVNEDRLKSINFTTSYANGVQSVIVPEGSDIKSVDDIKGHKVGVQLATTGDTYATGDFGKENVARYSNGNEAILALKSKDIDCIIIDNQPAKALVAANEGFEILDTSYADEDYAICVAKENTELLDNINKAIDELTQDGTIDAILQKYIK